MNRNPNTPEKPTDSNPTPASHTFDATEEFRLLSERDELRRQLDATTESLQDRTSLLDEATEERDALRAEVAKLRAAIESAQNDCDVVASNLCADQPTRDVEIQAQLLAGIAAALRDALK